ARLRVDVSASENGFWAEHASTIQDSYIHDLIDYNPATDPHTDAIQMPGGATNINIVHNRVYGNYVNQDSFGSSAITSGRLSDGGETNVLIQDNLIAGGGYAMYCVQGGSGNN